MKNIFRMFSFVGTLSFGCVAFAEEEQPKVNAASEGAIQVVCPVSTEECCENCENCETNPQPVVENNEDNK